MEAPMVLKESWPDGHRMQNNQDYSNAYKASVLEVEKLQHRRDSIEYKEMTREAKVLRGEKIVEEKK